jgi:E3 ubiquitin-protein ligase HECTD1
LPLSTIFLKLLVHPQIASSAEPSLDALLTIDEFEHIHPHKAKFLRALNAFVEEKRRIESDEWLSDGEKRHLSKELRLKLGDTECRVEDLSLTFTINPPSSVFSFRDFELIPNGAEIDVTTENVEVYLRKCLDFYLNSGIRQQISAFRQGFDLVFPLRSLMSFSPEEVQKLLSGEQCPEWTRDDILKHTEPKLGYTRDSPGFLRFVDVLVGMNGVERKAFLQFTTGCSSLPPGGLANLHPRLTVVRKVDSGDGSYPSVNTCVHYLKLPEYSNADILRERLLAATNEKGFHLN